MRFRDLAAQFQRGNCLFPTHTGKAAQELVNGVASLEVIVQDFKGTRVPTNTGVPPRISGSL